MPLRLARRWEARASIRKRVREKKPWLKEPVSSVLRDGYEEDDEDHGPPINTEFMELNTDLLYEMFDAWGMKPKPNLKLIHKEVGFANNNTL